jgi:hypothetical protein
MKYETEQRLQRLENQVVALQVALRTVLKVTFKIANWTSAPGAEDIIPILKALETITPVKTKSPR